MAGDQVPEPEPALAASHDVASIHPDDAELAARVAVAIDALDERADRQSEEAAHDAWEAEASAPPAEESHADVAEAYSPAVELADA